MCKQKTLTVAIASALIAGSGVVVAADQFQNAYVGMSPPAHDNAGSPPVPMTSFGFINSETLVEGEKDGIVYASELFGEGSASLTLPSGQTTGVGTYAAVIYTVDGKISKKFDLTFTLTNGATFSGAPLLGMDRAAASTTSEANALLETDLDPNENQFEITPTDGSAANLVNSTNVKVIRIGASADMYDVVVGTGDNITITQMGGSGGVPGALEADPVALGVWYVAPIGAKTSADIAGSGVLTVSNQLPGTGTATNVVLSHPLADNLIEGFSYWIAGSAPAGPFTIQTVGTGTDNNVTITPPLTAPVTGAITRAYIQGDSNIEFDMSLEGDGSNNTFQFGNDATPYEIIGSGGGDNYIIEPGIQGSAIIAGAEMYVRVVKGGGSTITTDYDLPISAKAGTGAGKSTATFELDATSGANAGGILENGTRLMLIYQIDKATALADPGQDIKMQVSLVTPITPVLVNPARELQIVSSKQAVEASMKIMDPGRVRIMVDSDSKAFSGSYDGGPFVNSGTVKIGFLTVETRDGVKTADGETTFNLGEEGAKASASTLDIEEGQFAASMNATDNGKVYVNVPGSPSKDIPSSNVTETTAHWALDDTDVQSIAGETSTIRFDVDGKNVINSGAENPPYATLVIDFDEETSKDIKAETELYKIKQDGTICTLYNVPPPDALDAISIRITNESTTNDDLVCTLRGMDGVVILDGINCFQDEFGNSIPIEPMETKRLTAKMLVALGAAWTGRAVLEIKSSLPDMQVMGLMRSSVPGSPLVGMSYGAHGKACTD